MKKDKEGGRGEGRKEIQTTEGKKSSGLLTNKRTALAAATKFCQDD